MQKIVVLNDDGYVCCRYNLTKRGIYKRRKDWFFVRYANPEKSTKGLVRLGTLNLPEKFVGKRIRLKVEVMSDDLRELKDDG